MEKNDDEKTACADFEGSLCYEFMPLSEQMGGLRQKNKLKVCLVEIHIILLLLCLSVIGFFILRRVRGAHP